MAPSSTDIEQKYDTAYKQQPKKQNRKDHQSKDNGFCDTYNRAEIGKLLTKDALERRVESINTDICEAGQEDAFFVADMGEVYRQHLRWKMKLNRVKPHYGMYSLFKHRSPSADHYKPLSATLIRKFSVYSLP